MSDPQTTAPGPHDGRHEAVRPKGAGPWRTLFVVLAVVLVLAIIALLLWIFVFSKSGGGTPTNTPTNTPTQTVSPPPLGACDSAAIAVALGTPSGAAGSTTVPLEFTNLGSADCTIEGFPAVLMIWQDNGPLGPPASDDTSATPASVTIKPGDTNVSALLTVEDADNLCDGALTALAIQVTLPGTGAPLSLINTGDYKGCDSVPFMTVGPITQG